MANSRHSRSEELEQLRGELVRASALLDELERRHALCARGKKRSRQRSDTSKPAIDGQMRFATCVSEGLLKLRWAQKQ